MARRRYQKGQILFSKSRELWLGRYREDTIRPDGSVIRARPQIVLGTKKELPTQRLAARKLDEILSRINDCAYQPTRIATVAEFAARWREEVLAKRKPSTVRSANSHLDSHILPQLGNLRLDQVGPENQQVFVNQLAGTSRKTVLNILSTLSSMFATAKNWGYSSGEIALRKLVLPERNVHVPAHFTRSQVESILSLANEPWRTFFIVLALTGLRAGEALGLQWPDIDFHHKCIHVRLRSEAVSRQDQTPHRFRTKRQLWAYCGLALRTYDSGEYRFVGGQLKRSKKAVTIRGLNKNHNHDLKNIFKGAAIRAAATAGPLQNFYEARIANGMKPPMARLTLARKIAAITLLVWKKGVRFDAEQLKQQAA